MFVVVAATDLLFNPFFSFWSTIGAGLTDLLYKPLQGVVALSLPTVALGLGQGLVNLGAATGRALLYSTSRFLQAATRGMVAGASSLGVLSTHLDSGVFAPTNAMSGLQFGIMGLVSEPLHAAGLQHSLGGRLAGLATGLARGAAGLFSKPLVGALVWSASALSALDARCSPGLRTLAMQRQRPPRFFRGPGARLTAYREEDNRGEELLCRVRRGAHRAEGCYFAGELEAGAVVVVTGRRVMAAQGFEVQWEVALRDLLCVELDQRGEHHA